jgi:hypothetical protein
MDPVYLLPERRTTTFEKKFFCMLMLTLSICSEKKVFEPYFQNNYKKTAIRTSRHRFYVAANFARLPRSHCRKRHKLLFTLLKIARRTSRLNPLAIIFIVNVLVPKLKSTIYAFSISNVFQCSAKVEESRGL